jgi:hypothetical protein
MPLAIYPTTRYAAKGANAPGGLAVLTLLIYFVVVPGLAFRQRTEILYDAMHVGLRLLVSGFLVFTAAYWLAPAETPFDSTPQTIAFVGVVAALYATMVFGVTWAIQFARKGTSGIDTDFQ